jgi:hypothetical protein
MPNRDDGSIAPRRSLGGPILPPPPPALAEDARKAEEEKAAAERAEVKREADRQAQVAEKQARDAARQQHAAARQADKQAQKETQKQAAQRSKEEKRARSAAPVEPAPARASGASGASRRTRRAQLRLVQVDAWSVMKTSFLLSIALGIVLVVAVAIIMGVLGAAGVWDSINSIVKQAVGGDGGQQFDIQQYVGTSRIIGFTMIVAVIDVILITAIATLGAFLYNLSAALLGGIEVTLAEDS